MQIFIDESGDPGFQLEAGSSRFFVVALVIFDDDRAADGARTALDNLKKRWHRAPTFEFKFSKLTDEERLGVLEAVAKFPYKVRAVVFDKVKMNELQLQHFKKNYYQYAIRSLLEREDCSLKELTIRIDTFGEDFYRQDLLEYFSEHLCRSHEEAKEHLLFQDSKFNVLIQLADLVAGSLRKSFDHTTDDAEIYRAVIADHEEDVKVFRSVLHSRS